MYRAIVVVLTLTACSSQPMVFRPQAGFVYAVPAEQALQTCKAQNLQQVHAARDPLTEAMYTRSNIERCMMAQGYVD